MEIFERSTLLPASADEAFAWHARNGAFERLLPPWESLQVEDHTPGSIAPGSRFVLRLKIGPFTARWVAVHGDVQWGRLFTDSQASGPMRAWLHEHRFEPRGEHESRLIDRIRYELPLHRLSAPLFGGYVARRIAASFTWRHAVTARDLLAHAGTTPLSIGITGSSGLVGSALIPFLRTGGHELVRIVRARGTPPPFHVAWDPAAGRLDPEALAGLDAVVHLAGENIAGGRWTAARRAAIRDSRVQGTALLARTLAAMKDPPRVLVCASAIGLYGDRGDELLDEDAAPGTGFLPEVCREWEAAADAARAAGIRVVHARLGVVLSPRGGALAKMLTPFRLGLGGRLGHGRQWMSWVSIEDVIGALHHAIVDESVEGALNVVAPQPVTNGQFSAALGAALGRPAIAPVPAFALRALAGQLADDLLLSSTRVQPAALAEAGYVFRQPELLSALRLLLGRSTSEAGCVAQSRSGGSTPVLSASLDAPS